MRSPNWRTHRKERVKDLWKTLKVTGIKMRNSGNILRINMSEGRMSR